MYYLRAIILALIVCLAHSQAFAAAIDYDSILDELKASLIAEPAKSSDLIHLLKENVNVLTREQHARLLSLESNKELFKGEYAKAYSLLVEAEQLTHSASLLNSIYLYQATALMALRNYQGALEAMAMNLSRIEEIDDITIKMTSYLRLANLYLDLQVFDEVKRYATLAFELSRGISAKEQCYAQLYIGVSELKQSNYQEAKSALTAARSYCAEHNIPLIVAMANKGIGSACFELGEYSDALKQFQLALNQYRQFQYQLEINDVNSLLAETYLSLSEYDNAVTYAQRVISLPDDPSHVEVKKRATKAMVGVLEKRGDYSQAYKYLAEYQTLSENLINETKAKAYAYQMAKFENAEKTREIKMLNQDRALYTAQQKLVDLARSQERLVSTIIIGLSVLLVIFSVNMFFQRRKYKRLSQLDQLTKILNRGTGQEAAEISFVDVLAHGGAFSVIMFDLDLFKSINDNYGHSAGDWALKEVVAAIKPLTGKQDLFVRMGGEEFALFLPYCTATDALALAERCRKAVAKIDNYSSQKTFALTASFGVCTSVEADLSLDPLMTRVDIAMYQSKANGRDRVTCYEPGMTMIPQGNLALEAGDD
ncbi:GGDEF domain-containing protein [Shewanella colwelliana]|uniref:diguanylate cyclase n=1 Tax=Shewanella colwelliana TaxID=23 RepID=A0ABQ4NW88_SHECO|nr:GGDEF domain-containing protein [Shewanella colwelliana]GIU28828.1 GGDEF domain-containing protein [Shewanella colwelliana]GIU37584.1 GGDEF domain-containing protein [Shewanella colwelliana]